MSIWLPPGVVVGPEYGTPGWHEWRRGLVTASRFGDVLTEPRTKAEKEAGGLGKTAKGYLMELVAATITQQDRVGGSSAAMERGVDKEADALDRYAQTRFVEVGKGRGLQLAGTIIGATPDGFVEEDEEGPGILEVKCPEAKTHLENWLTKQLPEDYLEQVHGQLWVSGRSWCDFVSFDDRFPLPMQLVVIRVYPDEEFHATLERKVRAFAYRVEERVHQVRNYLASCGHKEAQVINSALEDQLTGTTIGPVAD